ncbi:MAG TPA: AgmX/PglI C-terminal domain-containing protein [Polyangia bacterium]|nr:AgmX/PglI C-terminal domain-containing protein [Polyangia bacterium]
MKMTHMLGMGLVVAAIAGGAGCSKSQANAGGGPSPFDKRWETLQQQGAQAIRITDDRGAALMDNVLGAQGGALAMAPWVAQSLKGTGGNLPDHPDANDVQKLVRQYVPGVKSCYERMTREGDTRTGKAIVSFQIAGNGHVQALTVDAPAFDGSQLASCIDGQVSRWVFPASKQGLQASSYPFVFVGG